MSLNVFTPGLAEALGWTLLHSLWQGILIFVLTVPVLVFLKKHAPSVRYPILCIALLLLTAAMSFTFYLYFPETPDSAPLLEAQQLAPVAAIGPVGPADLVLPAEHAVVRTYTFRQSVREFIQLYAAYLVNCWLIGMFIFALRWLAGLLYTYRLKSHGVCSAEARWQERVDNWSKKIGIRKGVSLLESIKTDVPIILGHLKPVILLPVGTLNGLAPEQVEAIILHELAHVRRHDFIINLLISALEMVLFYHPVYWWLANQIQQEREKCCDDIAVAVCGNARLYAQTLLLMEEKRQQKSLAMAYQGKKHHLLDRIKRICIASPASYRPEYGKAGLSLALLFALVAISWAKMPEKPDYQAETTTVLEEPPMAPPHNPERLVAAPGAQSGSASTLPNSSNSLPEQQHAVTASGTIAHTTGADTIPYKPDIPAMRNQPVLPATPNFPYSVEALEAELENNSNDHEFLRGTIDKYQVSLSEWQASVQREYLQPWRERQQQMKDLYNAWKARIEKLADGDEVAEAVALNKGIRYFENAIKEEENAIKEASNVVKENLENYIKTFEHSIKYHEDKQADHDSRMAIHDDRMYIHDLRMSAHDERMKIHDQRMSIHDVRMAFHDDRMKAHDVIMAAFEKEFFQTLEADGLGKRSDKSLEFIATTNQVIINGKILDDQLAKKYRSILEKYGFEVRERESFIFNINENSRRIGTTSTYSTSSRKEREE